MLYEKIANLKGSSTPLLTQKPELTTFLPIRMQHAQRQRNGCWQWHGELWKTGHVLKLGLPATGCSLHVCSPGAQRFNPINWEIVLCWTWAISAAHDWTYKYVSSVLSFQDPCKHLIKKWERLTILYDNFFYITTAIMTQLSMESWPERGKAYWTAVTSITIGRMTYTAGDA